MLFDASSVFKAGFMIIDLEYLLDVRSYQLYFTTRDKVASAVQSFFMENVVSCDTSWKLELCVF